MGTLKQRRKPLTIRKAIETLEYANKRCEERIKELDSSSSLCSCPVCESIDHVKCVGTNRGRRKFKCSPNLVHDRPKCFTTSTSFEIIHTYQQVMAENLALLLKTNSVVDGIRIIGETSKHFVELPLERLYEYIIKEACKEFIHIEEGADLVTIFADITGSGLAKNKAIILAMIEGVPVFEVVTADNYLSTLGLVAAIKNRLEVPDTVQVVFVTDGEHSFVGPIRRYFPDAIHIRQFHKKSARGMVYAHLKHDNNEYTVRCPWNTVLEEGTPSNDVLEQRERRAKRGYNSVSEYTKLSEDIMIWKGTVFNPRGVRRKKRDKNRKTKPNKYPNQKNTSPPDTAKEDTHEIVFKGRLETAKKVPVFTRCFTILKKVFGGIHITSNIVENVFNIKSKLKEHRTMKHGNRILVCILYGNIVLKNMNKKETIQFLKEKVITKDFIQNKTLYGSGNQKNKTVEPTYNDMIEEAIENNLQLAIHYRDWKNRHTSRIITPTKIETSPYDNTTRIKAICHLRNAERTFHIDRIRDITIFEPQTLCFTPEP